ncbi:hypothetical protein HBDW_17360 [Herbaspirillum sp. DW155]|uniref:hypothetical protein n=1 Tax=Herbaspirillum sp. DW155 TaxID=3095609 RepID=UPI003089AA97|nr:hypothetical protein HBDW_17360 [Herbaspirillum sp. DW155]
MKTKTIIVASLLSALTLPVFAQTGAAATTAAPAATTAAPAKADAAKTEATPKAKVHHAKHKKSEKKAEKKDAAGTDTKAAAEPAAQTK